LTEGKASKRSLLLALAVATINLSWTESERSVPIGTEFRFEQMRAIVQSSFEPSESVIDITAHKNEKLHLKTRERKRCPDQHQTNEFLDDANLLSSNLIAMACSAKLLAMRIAERWILNAEKSTTKNFGVPFLNNSQFALPHNLRYKSKSSPTNNEISRTQVH